MEFFSIPSIIFVARCVAFILFLAFTLVFVAVTKAFKKGSTIIARIAIDTISSTSVIPRLSSLNFLKPASSSLIIFRFNKFINS